MSLVDYAASSSDEEGPAPKAAAVSLRAKLGQVVAAPPVAVKGMTQALADIDHDTSQVMYNPKYDELYAPETGPANIFKSRAQVTKKNTYTGYIEEGEISAFQFENQRKTFSALGYAMDPSVNQHMATTQVVGDKKAAAARGYMTAVHSKQNTRRRKRKPKGDPADLDSFAGPWADFEADSRSSKPSAEEQAQLDEWAEKLAEGKGKPVATAEGEEGEQASQESSILHIKDPYDYQGRSFLHPPQHEGVRYGETPERCYLPKKLIHTWSGHTKGVSAIRFIPGTAHLLLSAGLDNKVKLWEVYGERRPVMTYLGHTQGVRDISFNYDGTKFVSAGYDRVVRLWDTETGKCLSHFTNHKTPYCVKFHPNEDKSHLFCCGTSDKKIICWDINTGETVQEYDRHLGAVNSITFVEDGRRMVTTSDDKSLRVWEWDIPVDIKYIADPSMHSMPSVALHPNNKWMVCQSLDNQILTFSAYDRFRANRKKTFKGHLVSGYACQVNFSPDGLYVVSGDAHGHCCIWDWKTTRMFSKFKAHDKVCMGVEWNPNETSKLATCGWDGFIKYWD
eukprot:m.206228 g.206228  ORF g.206228 m.206228 type:complete len:563 (+) comp15020_c0_seq2:3914-5602(+)